MKSTVVTLRDLTGRFFDPTEMLVELLERLQCEFVRLRSEPESVATRADALCLHRDRMLTLQWGDRRVSGRCAGIAADGAIRLQTPAGVETFYSGSLRETPR